jgi:hypothetical protein
MKYYFIFCKSESKPNQYHYWNELIAIHPFEYIKNLNDQNDKGQTNFFLINYQEISETEYYKYRKDFN